MTFRPRESDSLWTRSINPLFRDYNIFINNKVVSNGAISLFALTNSNRSQSLRISKTFQKRLRSVWQLQKSVSYCLFGSKKHLMNKLFEKKSYPFYKFGDAIYLSKIGTRDWIEYICKRFEVTGKQIPKELAEKICQTVDNHSSYVQQLAWLIWIHTGTRKSLVSLCKLIFERKSLSYKG